MLSEKICFSDTISINDREYCQTTLDLFKSKSLYIHLERFSNIVSKENPEYNAFLNRYFNDEGYVDIWRIPHLLVDLMTDKCDFHDSLLSDESFRTKFMSFVGEFYNYCMMKCNFLIIEGNCITYHKSDILHMRKNQYLYNLIADAYCTVYEKLDNYGEMKRGEV